MPRGAFQWRPGDVLLAFSSSGEMRDVIEALDAGAPTPFAAITASPDIDNRIAGRRDRARHRRITGCDHPHAGFLRERRRSALGLGRRDGRRRTARPAIRRSRPDRRSRGRERAEPWATELPDLRAPSAGIVFGSRHAWAGALEGALLLKEVSGIPAEGVETREGATSAMYPLRPGHIVVSLPNRMGTPCSRRPRRSAPPAAPPCSALPAEISRIRGSAQSQPSRPPSRSPLGSASRRGLDVDSPAWTDAYYAVARGTS